MSGGGGGDSGQNATYFENIRNQEALNQRNYERQKENEEAATRNAEQQAARDAEAARQAKIRGYETSIGKSFDSMFTDDFYAKRQKEYTDYYKPQLDDQFGESQKKLTYWLADRGTLNSSIRNDKAADLQKTYDTGLRQINNSALDMTNQTKSAVANKRASLINDARAGNAVDEPTVSSALTGLNTPTTSYSAPYYTSQGANTFADLFGVFSNALSKQAAFEKAAYISGDTYKPTFNTGLFGGNSVRVLG